MSGENVYKNNSLLERTFYAVCLFISEFKKTSYIKNSIWQHILVRWHDEHITQHNDTPITPDYESIFDVCSNHNI